MKTIRQKSGKRRQGFTLVEAIISTSVGSLITIAVMSTYMWAGKQAYTCTKMAWSHNEATSTASKIADYLRNAEKITAIDEAEGRWVQVQFTDGSIGTLSYTNGTAQLRDGRMYLERFGKSEEIIARGLTELQQPNGFTTPIFRQVRQNALRIAYRVSEPVKSGGRDANDGAFAAAVQFGVCLRNAVPEEEEEGEGT